MVYISKFYTHVFHCRQMRADSDFSNLQASHTRMKDQLEQVQRDNISLEEKERQHSIQHKGLSAKFKNSKEEVRKICRSWLMYKCKIIIYSRSGPKRRKQIHLKINRRKCTESLYNIKGSVQNSTIPKKR